MRCDFSMTIVYDGNIILKTNAQSTDENTEWCVVICHHFQNDVVYVGNIILKARLSTDENTEW